MNVYITNGISNLKEMKKHYNGIPYKDLNTSDYDYFNASPEMAPTEEGQHWDSRNPHTSRLLKGENHQTFDLMVDGENKAGYKIVRGYNGELYSIPTTPDNYVENYNSFGDGGDTTQSQQQAQAESSKFLRNWYSNPTTQSMLGELDYNDYTTNPVTTPTGMEISDPNLARRYKTVNALNTPVNYVDFEDNHYGRHTMNSPTDPSKNFIEINEDLFGNSLTNTLIHEKEHAIQTQMPFVNRTTQPVEHKLKPEYDVDPYLDKPKEVRSRIMETRNFFNLDPNKRDYTPAEAAEMQKQLMEAGQRAGSASELNRLTPETMAGYLNYMASNDTQQTPINNMGMPMYEDGVNYAANGGRILNGTSEKNQTLTNEPIELPGVVVTPNGNYVKYSPNNEGVSFTDYRDARVQQDRITAINNILNLESPLVPKVPNKVGKVFTKIGLPDKFVIPLTGGPAKNPHTCIYTTTGMFPKGSQVSGNKTFAESYKDFGFERVNDMQKGDMLQLLHSDGTPYHSVLITGFDNNRDPLLTYANGGIDRDLNNNGIIDDSEKHMRYNKANLYDDEDSTTPDFAIARGANEDEAYDIFRYVGNPEQITSYFKEYKRMYGNKNKK